MPNVTPILMLVVSALLAACGGTAATPTPSQAIEPEPTAVPAGPSAAAAEGVLVTFESRGGECPQGPCGIKVVIGRDGSVERSDGMAQRVDQTTLDRLTALVDSTDWDAVLAVPFQGECPVNVDGQEQVFTFTTEGRVIEAASCTVLVDPAAEPFATVLGIIFGTGG